MLEKEAKAAFPQGMPDEYQKGRCPKADAGPCFLVRILPAFPGAVQFLRAPAAVWSCRDSLWLCGQMCIRDSYYTRQKFDFRQYMNNGGQQND